MLWTDFGWFIPPVHNKVISGQVVGLKPATEGSLQISGRICYVLCHQYLCCRQTIHNKVISGFSGPPPGQGASGEAQTRDRRADSLATVPPTALL
ncbi:hypothetical protein PoB_002206500 [Plakobranchus ocellatus]|uniref:Uncharacterized protein n=1 Tax=Plakobranchus ocellatus TaxID=259542 RepID=A0AAV3ZLY0_9GAST|nr:hypothetical protein PoB_002206500 [Plakobranchus ocellatus]